ncbi:MAG: preprotein translocase subunit YajC, partial [Acidimicrobiia bacterium]
MPVVVPVVIAQESAAGGSGLPSIIFLVAMGAIFYFLIIRPQRQRARHQQQLVESLAVGDQVQTIGGIQGRISEMDDSTVLLEV